jgi:hypothetical protein
VGSYPAERQDFPEMECPFSFVWPRMGQEVVVRLRLNIQKFTRARTHSGENSLGLFSCTQGSCDK